LEFPTFYLELPSELSSTLKPNLTRTAWAVFKYCGTKTVTLRIKKI
jgi:hypothetical protein